METQIEAFLHFVTVEKGYSEHTAAAYHNDLTQILGHLADEGISSWQDVNRADILKDQIRVINALYDPEKFMSRVAEAMLRLRPVSKHKPKFAEWWTDVKGFCRVIVWMHRRPETRRHFWRLMRTTLRLGKSQCEIAGAMATIYLHLAEMQTELVKSLKRRQEGEPEIEASAGNFTR